MRAKSIANPHDFEYVVFHRTWWKRPEPGNPKGSPDNKEPHIGKRTVIGYTATREAAQAMATKWNNENPPRWNSRKAEFQKQ